MEVERQRRPEDEALPRHLVAEPPQHAVDARPQLRVVVRLRDVVLGDLLEQVGLGVAGVDRGQHDDRQIGPAFDLPGEGQAIHAGHHHVDDQEVRPGRLEPAQRLVTVARGLNLVAVGAELVGEKHELVRVVVDEKDAGQRLAAVAARTAAEHGPEYREWPISASAPAPRLRGVLSAPNARRPRGYSRQASRRNV
jgi:hypothetical protein